MCVCVAGPVENCVGRHLEGHVAAHCSLCLAVMLRLSQRFVWASHAAVTTARCSVRRHAAAVGTARAGTPTLPSEWRVSAQWRGLHVARPVLSEDDEDTSAAGGDEGVADDNDQFLADMRSEVWMQVNKAGVDADAFPENPYTSRVAYSPTWTTDKGDPQQHTADDVGLFYDLPSDLASVFPDGYVRLLVWAPIARERASYFALVLATSTPGTLEAEEFATTCQTSLMIRDQGVELIDLMKSELAWRRHCLVRRACTNHGFIGAIIRVQGVAVWREGWRGGLRGSRRC